MRRVLAASLLSISLIPAVSLLAPREAAACSCLPAPPPLEAAQAADVVFHGKLLAIADAPKPGKYDIQMKIFTFEVVRSFKGQCDPQVNVYTAESGAACGRGYGEVGSEWLIYARVDDTGQTHDNLCSRTRPIDQAADDIEVLEANPDALDQPPAPTEPPGPADPEPEPVLPTDQSEPEPGPEPAEPRKKGCAVVEPDGGGFVGLLGLGLVLGLGLTRRPRS